MEQNAPKRDMVSTLARVLGGGFALVMLGSAVAHTAPYISSAGQAAATWIGDETGAPEGQLGRSWPDDPNCYYVVDDAPWRNSLCPAQTGWGDGQIARPLYADDDYAQSNFWGTVGDFYSAVFSVSPADADPTGQYLTNTYDGPRSRQDEYKGKAGPPPYQFGLPDCSQWQGSFGLDFWGLMGLNGYFLREKGATTSDPLLAHCWTAVTAEDPPKGGRNPSTPGQTAFSISEYARWLKIKDLGGEVCVPVDPNNPDSGQVCGPPALPAGAQSGDQVMQMDPIFGNNYPKFPISRDYHYWQMRPNSAPNDILHEAGQRTVGAIPIVAPGENITLQWACQPSREVRFARCGGYNNPIDHDCIENETGGWWSVGTIFTSASGSATGPVTPPAFSTGGLPRSKKTIRAATEPGTYTYTLTCSGPAVDGKILSVKVKVGAACESPTSAERVLEGATVVGYKLPPQEARTYTLGSRTFCAYNGTDSTYFVPVKTAAEFQAFINAVTNNQVAGVSPN